MGLQFQRTKQSIFVRCPVVFYGKALSTGGGIPFYFGGQAGQADERKSAKCITFRLIPEGDENTEIDISSIMMQTIFVQIFPFQF